MSDESNSHRLHQEVPRLSREIGFLGGAGSSLFDLAMLDQQQGLLPSARQHFQAAGQAFAAGGYQERLPIVDRALAVLTEPTTSD